MPYYEIYTPPLAHGSHRLQSSIIEHNSIILCINMDVAKTENKFKMYYDLFYSVITFFLFTINY